MNCVSGVTFLVTLASSKCAASAFGCVPHSRLLFLGYSFPTTLLLAKYTGSLTHSVSADCGKDGCTREKGNETAGVMKDDFFVFNRWRQCYREVFRWFSVVLSELYTVFVWCVCLCWVEGKRKKIR